MLSMLLFALSDAPVRAADVTGTWRVTISTPDGAITGKASFRQTGHVVAGWVGPSEDNPIPIAGILRLTIGTIDTDKGTIGFVRSAPTASRP